MAWSGALFSTTEGKTSYNQVSLKFCPLLNGLTLIQAEAAIAAEEETPLTIEKDKKQAEHDKRRIEELKVCHSTKIHAI